MPDHGSQRRRCAVLGLFLLSQLVVLFVLVELGARVLDPFGISYYPEQARFFDTLVLDDRLGYRLRPGLDGRYHGVRVHVNALGLRGDEIPAAKPPGEFRIALLGDSGVFGPAVEVNEALPAALEAIANESAPEGLHYRALNLGVTSYNTEQELALLESAGLPLAPDAVVLVFSENDIEPAMWVLEKRAHPIVDLAQRSYAASLAYIAYRNARSLLPGKPPPLIQRDAYARSDPRWQAVEGALEEMARLLGERGIPFLVVHPLGLDPAQTALLAGVGDRAGFPVRLLDRRRDARFEGYDERELQRSTLDSHCNPLGCRVRAQLLYDVLREEGMLAPGAGRGAREPASPSAANRGSAS